MESPELDVEPMPEPTDDERASLSDMAREVLLREDRIAELSAVLRAEIDAYNDLRSRRMPEAMTAIGQSEFALSTGEKVSIADKYVGSKLTDPAGIDWVIGHDGATLVKSVVTIAFDATDRAEAERIYQALRRDPAANRASTLTLERSVHQSTIASYVANRIRDRKPVPPLETLGVSHRVAVRVGKRRYDDLELKGLKAKE